MKNADTLLYSHWKNADTLLYSHVSKSVHTKFKGEQAAIQVLGLGEHDNL